VKGHEVELVGAIEMTAPLAQTIVEGCYVRILAGGQSYVCVCEKSHPGCQVHLSEVPRVAAADLRLEQFSQDWNPA